MSNVDKYLEKRQKRRQEEEETTASKATQKAKGISGKSKTVKNYLNEYEEGRYRRDAVARNSEGWASTKKSLGVNSFKPSERTMEFAREYATQAAATKQKKQLQNMVDEYKQRVGNKTQTISPMTVLPRAMNPYYEELDLTLESARKDPDFTKYVEKGSKDIISGYSDDLLGKIRTTAKSLNPNVGLRARHLTDEEKEMYNYILGKYGRSEADDFEESLSPQTNQRMTEEISAETRDYSKKHPVKAVGLNAIASIQSGEGYLKALATEFANQIAQGANSFKRGYDEGLTAALSREKEESREQSQRQITLDPNDEAFLGYAQEEASRKGIKDRVHDTFGESATVDSAVDIGLAVTQNIARLPFGDAGLAVAAGGAATGGYKSALERGGTNEQALGLGAAQGAAEAFFEKYSLEGLKELQAVPVKAARDVFKNLLKQGFTEGQEEILTEFANTMTDEMIMKELSEFEINRQNYINMGLSEEEAALKANQDFFKQLGLAGVGGAISGGVMGGGAMALGQISQNMENRQKNQLIIDPLDPTTGGRREDVANMEFAREYKKYLAGELENNAQEPSYLPQNQQQNIQTEESLPSEENVAKTARELSKEIFASFGENGAKAASENYDPNLEMLDYNRAFGKYYDAGRHNNTMQAAENSPITSILTKEQAQAAYDAGLADFKLEQSQMVEYKQGAKKEGIFENQSKNATKAQAKFLERVGTHTGLKVVLVDDMDGVNASYESGTITISANSKNLMGTTSHELTHFIRENAPKDYEMYRDLCINYMMESKNVSLDRLIETYQRAYTEQGQNLTRDQIKEEIVADATTDFFNDEEFIKKVAKKDRTIAEKIIDFLNDVIDAMKELLSTTSRLSSAAIKENLQHYESARDVWMDALETASESYKSGKELVQKKETRYQLANPDLVNEEQIESNFETVRNMKPVAELTGKEFEGKRGVKYLTEAVMEYYNSLGNVVHNDVVGDIILNRRSVKDDIAHGYNDLKAIAFKAVPEVLTNGKVLDYSKNWKQRGYDTAIIGAKVNVSSGKDAGEYYQICVTKVTGKENRMYLHEVQIVKMNGDNPFKTWAAQGGLPSGDVPFIYSIFDKLNGVNNLTKIKNITQGDSDTAMASDGSRDSAGDVLNSTESGNVGLKPAGRLANSANGVVLDGTSRSTRAITKSNPPGGYAPSDSSISNKTNGVNNEKRFQLKDSDGNKLSEGQAEYFKDSKVRDENGNLQVMYHGTPNAGFTEFRPGTYFTPNKWYAEFYHDKSASMLRTKQTADSPDTYKVYLDIKKPFDTRLPEVREIWDNDFYMQWGNGTPLMESGLPDWVDGEDIVEFIEENELDFDGVILDEGGIYDDDGNVRKRGLSYIVMSPEQVKNVTNQNPTKSSDIRFQLQDIEEYYSYSDVESIVKTNDKLQKANEKLKEQLILTKDYKPRKEDISKYAGEILKTYNSSYSKKTLSENLSKLYEYMGNTKKLDMDEMAKAAASIGHAVLNKAKPMDAEDAAYNKKLLETIRKTTIKVPREVRAELMSEGGYGVFRQKYFRKLTLNDKGITIDAAYEQLKSQFPEQFDAGILNPADQLFKIAEVVDNAQPKIENPYGAHIDDLSVDLGQEILDYRVNIRNIPPTLADKLFEKADQKEFEYRAARKEYEEKMRDYRKTLREREQSKSVKKQIIRDVTRMQTWLTKPTDKEHVPEKLRTAAAEFLSYIDYSTSYKNQFGEETKRTLAWQSVQKTYETILASGNMVGEGKNAKYVELDPDLAHNIEDLIKKVKGIDRLDDLGYSDLITLRNTVASMKKTIQDVDFLYGNDRYETAGKAAKQSAMEMGTRKQKWTPDAAKMADRILNTDMLDSITFFERMGPAAESMFQEIRKGFDKKIRLTKVTADYFKNLKTENKLTAKQMREWSEDIREFKPTGGGDTLKLSVTQIMSLYELTKRPQAKKHIWGEGARGIRTRGNEEIREVKIGNKTVAKVKGATSITPVKFSANEVSEIVNTLTPEQKAVADGIGKFFVDYTGKWGNEVSMLMYSYKKFNDTNYFPISVDRNELATNSESLQQTRTLIKNLGMTKSTVKDAKNAIIIDDIFEVFAKHADQMASYRAFVPALSDFHKFYNYTDEEFKGLKEKIEVYFGKDGNAYIEDFLIDVNGGMGGESDPTAGLLRNVKAAAVGANIRTIIQQPTAYMRAMMEIDPKYLGQGLKKAPEGSWEECKEYCAITQWKEWGFFDVNTGRSMRSILLGSDSLREKVIEWSMAGAGKADEIAWTHLWLAVKAETSDLHPELTGEAYLKACGDRMSEVIDRTQVVDSVFHRSRAMKKKGWDLYTAFMSEPTKSYNMLYRAVDQLNQSKYQNGGKATKEAKAYLNRAVAVYAVTGTLTAVVAAVWDTARDDDDEKRLWEKYIENLLTNLADNLNPLNMIPVARDIFSIFSGYSSNRMDLQAVQQLKYSITELGNYIAGESKYNFAGLMQKWLRPISMLTGIPVANLIKDVNASIDLIFAINEEVFGAEWAHAADYLKDRIILPVGNKKNLSQYTKKALKAYSMGKRATGDRILKDLRKAGIDKKDIDEKVKSIIKDSSEVEEAAKLFMDGKLKEYAEKVEEISEIGVDKELIIKAVQSKVDKISGNEEEEKKTEEEIEKEIEEEEKEEPSLYRTKDITYALDSGNTENAQEIATYLYKAKRESGRTANEARKDIKTALSDQYKKRFLALDPKTEEGHEARRQIRQNLERIALDGKAIFAESDFVKWIDNDREEKKKKK